MSEQAAEPEPESASEVLRASHILVVRIDDARFGDWLPEEAGPLKRRFVELHLTLEETLRGRTDQVCGEGAIILVRQRGTGTLRVAEDAGVWSHVELARDLRLVAFCAGPSTDIAVLLQPPACQLLLGPDALPDVRAALDLQGRNLQPVLLLARAAPLLEQRGDILARYLWARTRAAVLTDETAFETLMRIVEAPATSRAARDVLITAVQQELGLIEAPPWSALLRFARAMLVLLTMPAAEALHPMLAQVYLPNLLGLTTGAPALAARDVFGRSDGHAGDGGGAPDEATRAQVQAALASRPDLDPEGLLRGWLTDRAPSPRQA
ncbi:MAG: hypothetical protein ABUS79_11045 [Pseudomonadota bacterium]